MTGLGGGYSAKEMQERHRHEIDNAPVTARCLFCNWTETSTVAQARQSAQTHRATEHPHAIQTRRRRSGGASLGRWTHGDDGYQAEGLARAAKVAAGLARLEDT